MSGKKRRDTSTDKGRLPPFVPLLKDTLQTPAWRAMSHGARSLYVALRSRIAIDCRNNGHVYLSTRTARKEIGSDMEQVVRWFRELQHFGFIVQTIAGQLGVEGKGKAPHWRLTELGIKNAEGGLDMPTRDFLRWNGKRFNRNTTTFEKQNPARESRNTPLGKAETLALGKAETQTALTARESPSIETPKVLGKAQAYLDNHLHAEGRSGAPRSPRTDGDDNELLHVSGIVDGLLGRAHEQIALVKTSEKKIAPARFRATGVKTQADFASWLKLTRMARGISDATLAAMVGLRAEDIEGLEKGKVTVSTNKRRRIVDVLTHLPARIALHGPETKTVTPSDAHEG